jgi:hypothetical protein
MLVQQLDHLLYKSFPNGTPNPNLQGPTFWLWTWLFAVQLILLYTNQIYLKDRCDNIHDNNTIIRTTRKKILNYNYSKTRISDHLY